MCKELRYYIYLAVMYILINSNSSQSYFRTTGKINYKLENKNKNCRCVPPHLCADNNGGADGYGLLDIRFADATCPNQHHVCCKILLEQPGTERIPSCGIQNSVSTRVTSHSEQTELGELPWTVLVLQRDRKVERNAFICGGSLIHPQVVITAAHCVQSDGIRGIKVRAGEWNLKNTQEELPHQDSLVEEVIVHPAYRPGSLWNDIAILFLYEPMEIARNVGFICLPSPDMQIDAAQCIASGWGKVAPKKRSHAHILRKVSLPLIPKNQCTMALRNTRLGKFYKLHRSFICAGGQKKKDTCKGDGGSPLICPIPGQSRRYFQLGIVSWGIGCGNNKTPGVYVNVPLYVDWIDQLLLKRNFNTSYYKM